MIDAIELDLMALADIGQPTKIAHEIHRQLRSQMGSVPTRAPLHAIAKAVGIVGIADVDADSFEGTLVIQDGRGAIGLRRGLRSGRRNFTLGHEIGHFMIPTHRFQKSSFQCSAKDMALPSGTTGATPLEKIEFEASEFSAVLLVPEIEWTIARRKCGHGCDLNHIQQLAESFDVSQEMMAKIYVRNADENIAVLITQHGRVYRIIPGVSFPYMGLRKNMQLPTSAEASRLSELGGKGTVTDLRETDASDWVARADKTNAIYEQTLVQEDGWAMTLLVAELPSADEEDDRSWNRRSSRR